MAVTTINLSDPVSTLVSKTNTISTDLGEKATLQTTNKTSLVAAVNEINAQLLKVDSADILRIAQENSMDSAEVLAIITADSGSSNILSNFIKDSANGIGLDSSQGRFFIPTGTINTSMLEVDAVTTSRIGDDQVTEDKIGDDAVSSVQLKTLSTLLIKDSAGSTLKTIHGAGV